MRRRRRTAIALVMAAAASSALVGGTAARFSATTTEDIDVASHPDWTAPTASPVTIAKSTGGENGYIRQGGTYYAYANVTDSGNPAAGVGTVTAGASNITTGQTAAAMTTTGGPFTVNGTSYSHRTSAALTANGTLTNGASLGFTIAANDTASPVNTMTPANGSVTVDNTAPSPSAVATTNGGATLRRPEQNDTVTFTWNDTIDPYSVISTWSGSAQNVVVRINNGTAAGGNDALQVWNSANTTQLNLTNAIGLNLGRNDYVGANRTYGLSGTASVMTRSGASVTITLGTASGLGTTGGGNGTMIWTPLNTLTDRAGNASTTTAFNETGTADGEF